MGTGKTIIAYGQFVKSIHIRSSIIEYLRREHEGNARICVAFFYCDRKHLENQDPRNLLGSISRQIFPASPMAADPVLMERLGVLYDDYGRGGKATLEPLISALELIADKYDQVYVLIDGLDECKEWKALMDHLLKLVTSGLSILVTSRPWNEFAKVFKGESCVEMEMDASEVRKDISTHINYVLNKDNKFVKLDPVFKQEMAEKLREKAEDK